MENNDFICPRCEGYIPNNIEPGAYPGAISRWDNKTEICSPCGTEEAILALVAVDEWPLTKWIGTGIDEDTTNRFISAWARKAERIDFDELREGVR